MPDNEKADTVDREESKKRLSERILVLQKAAECTGRPGWAVILEFVSGLEKVYEKRLYETRDSSEIFHLQGAILGLRTLTKLSPKIENELLESRQKLAELDKG